ncbi:hypothetical protein [Roseinatronobacter sp. S2]|uniref:hypothetical protein n=1 Tax=Roseinatronobacter sp. S2 TaxID=3035471 RepID=UPI0024105475|nr:hypothetical protein [Roseinatronobacter sp. S2]WFE75552.1 hypothetical protein P8S53_03840 [Roseinatronobacter sp. S2]
MSVTSASMTAKEAIKAAFRHFDELFADSNIDHILLEGVDFLDDEGVWKVTIGFDAGRRRSVSTPTPLFGAQTEPLRETRDLYLYDNTGDLKRMD